MAREKDVEKKFQQLLQSRRIPVDEDRLAAMREGLLSLVPRGETEPEYGFFHRYRFALSFGTALVLIGLLVWQFRPLGETGPTPPLESELARVLDDEEQFTDMLVLFHDFTSARAQDGLLADWTSYNPSWLENSEGEKLFETFYGWVTQPLNSEPSAMMPARRHSRV